MYRLDVIWVSRGWGASITTYNSYVQVQVQLSASVICPRLTYEVRNYLFVGWIPTTINCLHKLVLKVSREFWWGLQNLIRPVDEGLIETEGFRTFSGQQLSPNACANRVDFIYLVRVVTELWTMLHIYKCHFNIDRVTIQLEQDRNAITRKQATTLLSHPT
jgi:hypothetical protein